MLSLLFGTPPAIKVVIPRLGLLALAAAGLGIGGCSQRPQDVSVASHGKEYFPSSVYGRASKRVVADGQPVPRGGGQYLVGKPYTIAGRTYYPSESRRTQVGTASWYGDAFHGRLTANGEVYDRDGFTAASPTMPLPSYARVTNLRNNTSMIVRVNDRGPYASDRIMDVSRRVAEALDFKRYGTAKLKVEYVGHASLAGSDDAKLYATLRTNGPARWQSEPTMVAEAARPARVASLTPYVPHAREAYPPVRRPLKVAEEIDAPHRAAGRYETDRRGPRRFGRAAPELASYEREVLAPSRRFAGKHEQGNDVSTAARASVPAYRHSYESREAPSALVRLAHGSDKRLVLPPSRPMDLGTIPGAASQIRARHEPMKLRLARSRDD